MRKCEFLSSRSTPRPGYVRRQTLVDALSDMADDPPAPVDPIAEVTADRPRVSSAGQRAPAEALPAICTLPSETALLELALHMLTGGSGEPAAPAEPDDSRGICA